MINKFYEKLYNKHKLTIIFFLSVVLCSPTVFADGNFFTPEPIKGASIKLINPQNTNISQQNNISQQTSIPFNLRGDFNEADYFSSNIEDVPQTKPPPPIDFTQLPAPSEYQKINNTNTELEEIRAVYKTKPNAGNFFNPQEESQEVIFAETTETPTNTPNSFEIINEDIYNASLASYADIDLEGKQISKIKFYGLKTINPQKIIEKIKSQQGTLFNNEILQQDLQNIYSIGYFSDNMSVEPVLNSDNTVELTFVLEENIFIENVSITGNNVVSTAELLPFISDLKNKPQNLYTINLAIENIQNYYHQKGYILANVHSVDDSKKGELEFSLWEGTINAIKISGNERTKDYVIQRNIITQAGTVYNEEFLKRDLAKIFSTQIFEEVNRDIKPSEENIGTYDVIVVVKEKATNSVSLGGGIDTGLGAFGSLALKEDNFLGRAQSLSLSGIIGSGILLNDASIKNHMNYQAELNFFEPHFLNADNSLMAKLYFREMGSWNIPLAIEQRVGFRTGIEHKIKDNENLRTSFSAGVEHINLKEGDFNKISSLYAKHHLNIKDRAKQLSGGTFFHLTPGIKYNTLDNQEIPREGIVAQLQFNEAIGVSDFNQTNGRLSGAITRFFPVFKKSSFSLTGKAGIKVHGDDMPEIMAYRLGGPYSIRGFRMNGVGTGDSFMMGSAEFATPLPFIDKLKWNAIKKVRLTFFMDAGKVFDPTMTNVLYDRPLHAITAGVGLKLYIPGIGPMSIDYGIPIINPGKYGSEHGYFTFGTGGMNGMYGY